MALVTRAVGQDPGTTREDERAGHHRGALHPASYPNGRRSGAGRAAVGDRGGSATSGAGGPRDTWPLGGPTTAWRSGLAERRLSGVSTPTPTPVRPGRRPSPPASPGRQPTEPAEVGG